MKYLENGEDELLFLIESTTKSKVLEQYVSSLLIKRLSQERNISKLYRKRRENAVKRNDTIWNSIVSAFSRNDFLVDTEDLRKMLDEMPVEYLSLISTTCSSKEIRKMAHKIGEQRIEKLEKELGVYDKAMEKFLLDEEEMLRLEKRNAK